MQRKSRAGALHIPTPAGMHVRKALSQRRTAQRITAAGETVTTTGIP